MTKKKEEKTSFPQLFKFFSDLIETLVYHSDAKVQEMKQKAVHYIIVYGMFLISILFVLLGIVKYLAEIYVFPTEGIGFMVVGSIIIVVLSAYTLINRV